MPGGAAQTAGAPIDVSQIYDIVFEGDNSKTYDGMETGRTVYFTFLPSKFINAEYWNEVNAYWQQLTQSRPETGDPPITTSAPDESAHADTP